MAKSLTAPTIVSLRAAVLAGLSPSPYKAIDAPRPAVLRNLLPHDEGLVILQPWERPPEFDTILLGMDQAWPYPLVFPGAVTHILFANVNNRGLVYPLAYVGRHWALQDPYEIENFHYEAAVQQQAVVSGGGGSWSFPAGLPTTYATEAEAQAAADEWVAGQHRLDLHERWLWHRADFGSFWLAVNGRDTLYFDPTDTMLKSSLLRRADSEPHLQINTACNLLGQLLIGGLYPYDNWMAFMAALWERYHEAKAEFVQATPMWNKETVLWSPPGGGSIAAIVKPEWFLGESKIYNGDFRIFVEHLQNPAMLPVDGLCPNWADEPDTNWHYDPTVPTWDHVVTGIGGFVEGESNGVHASGIYSAEFDALVSAGSAEVFVEGDAGDPYALTASGRHYFPCTYTYDEMSLFDILLKFDADTAFDGYILSGHVREVAGWVFQHRAWTYEHDPVRGTTGFHDQDYLTGVQTYSNLDLTASRVLHWDDQGSGVALYATQVNPYLEAHQAYRVSYEVKIITGEFWVEISGQRGAIRSALDTPDWVTYVEYLTYDGLTQYVSLVGKGEGYIRHIEAVPVSQCDVLDPFMTCEAGWLQLVGAGEVLNLKPLSRSVVAYCTHGVWLLFPVSEPEAGFGSRQLSTIGIGYRDAVAGTALQHAYIDAVGNLVVIEEQAVLQGQPPAVLGFTRWLKPLLERGPVIMSHDPALNEWRMGNVQDGDQLGYIWTPKHGLSEHLQAFGPATYFDGSMLCLSAPSEEMKDFKVRFEDLSFGTTNYKTLTKVEVFGLGIEDAAVSVEYRHSCSGDYTVPVASVPMTDRLTAELNVSGAYFNIEITGKGTSKDARISDILVYWTVKE